MRRPLFFFVLFAVLVLGLGCGQSSFVGKNYDNFSAYYNTFYNAERALEEGIKSADSRQTQQPIDQDIYLPLFGEIQRGTTQRQPFEDAIKKSSDILREHPDSKWVDDALLVIGKAWFYTLNYVGAEQKFREMLTVESRLHDEARFWLARTLIASGQYDLAFDHLQESLNREEISRRWESKLRLALAELHVQRESWEEAATELEAGLEEVRDNDLAAHAQFLLGQVYETLGYYDEAVVAYERVGSHNPIYELLYAAKYNAVRVAGDHGDPEAALRKLRKMERDDKNYEHRAELAYLRGRVLEAAGFYEDALDVYYELLYNSDRTVSIGEVLGPTHYALGVFYRDIYEDFPLASAHFDTARTGLQRRPVRGVGPGVAAQPAYAPAAIIDSEEQADIFGSFARVMDEMILMDSLLYLGHLDDSTFQAIVLELRQKKAEELEAQRREQERMQSDRQFRQASDQLNRARGGARRADKDIGQGLDSEAGFLYHRNSIRVQEGRQGFIERWGDRPLVPNWRRLDAATGVAAAAAGEAEGGQPGEVVTSAEDGLPEIDTSNVPRDSLSQQQMYADRAIARYELANVLFLSMNRPDSAVVWYRMVIEEDGDEPVAQRAFYALAEVQRALGDTLAARGLYQTILASYPESDFAEQSRERLGGQPDEAPTSDSLALAEAAYAHAYATWQSRAYEQSLNEMVTLAVEYRDTEVAPRALLAAGSIYMEWVAQDSLDLFQALPLAIPDSVLQASGLFPSTRPATPQTTPAPADTLVEQIDTPVKQIDQPVKQIDQPVKQIDQPVKQIDQPVKQIDQLAEIPDSLLVADSLELAMDSLAVGADSLAQAMVPDSTVAPEPEPLRLETLYAALVSSYPQAPQTPRAQRVLTALQERKTALQAFADSLAADSLALIAESLAAADTLALATDTLALATDTLALATDSLAAEMPDKEEEAARAPVLTPGDVMRASEEQQRRPMADSSVVQEQKDSLLRTLEQQREQLEDRAGLPPPDTLDAPSDTSRAEADTTEARPAARPNLRLPGPPQAAGPIDWSQGGWTIYVHTETEQQKADAYARNFGNYLRNTGYPVEVYTALVRKEVEYRVGVGLFANELDADEAFARLKGRLPGEAKIVRIPKSSQ